VSELEPHLHPESVAIRAGRDDNSTALAPILWASSAFVTPTLDEARRMSTVARADRFYSRYSNPTVKGFEDAVAQLEGAEAALAFASGMGAIATVVFALCSPGDHIVAQRHIYSGTQLFLQGACNRFGIDVTLVDGTKHGAFAEAVRPVIGVEEFNVQPRGCTITGTEGDDRLTGTAGDDVICGLGGNDVLRGRGGNDRLLGGEGDDTLLGDAGADVLSGGPGNDEADGGPGRDRCRTESSTGCERMRSR